MSYDLFLHPAAPDEAAFRNWFALRRNYRLSDGEAFYANDDTGVYFNFSRSDDGVIAFNLNYFRPHIFALEAEPEVAAFVRDFNCSIEDPQNQGMSDGPYSAEGFFSGWNAGNRFAFQAVGPRQDEPPLSADPALIEAAWVWNRARAEMQNAAGNSVFVPKVCWVVPTPGEAPLACVTWTWGVPTIIPENLVTRLVLVRQKKPSLLKMFSRGGDQQPELKLLNVEEGIRLTSVEPTLLTDRDVLVTPITGALEVQTLFMGNWAPPQFQIVPAEAVCGSDLVALTKRA